MKIQKNLRPLVLTQLGIPLVLLVLGIYHGVMQVLYRAGIIQNDSMFGLDYYQGLTLHGVVNAIVLTTFFAIAFGNVIVSQFLGQSVPVGGAVASFVVLLTGTLMVAASILLGRASVLYTFYPPLKASPEFYAGLALFVIGSWIAFYVWIPSYLKWSKANPTKKTPMAVVGIFVTFVVWQIATLPVAYEVLVQLLPWSFGFVPGVNVVLARTLFWFFGHPLVYFWLLPTYVMYYSMLPKIAGGKLYSDFAGRFSFLLFAVLSSPLGLHHQFGDPGIGSGYKALHSALTMLVAIPSFMTAFTIAASLEHASMLRGGRGLFGWWKRLPYFDPERWLFPYLFLGLVIFILGGITGLVNASFSMNNVVHNTAWIPAHFHLTVGGPVFLGILGMSLFLILGLTGKKLACPRVAMLVPYLWTLGVFTFSSGLFWGGLHGEPRRTNMGLSYLDPQSPSYRPDWVISTHVGAVGGSIMALAVLFFFYALITSLFGSSSAASADAFELPESIAYHDEDVPALRRFKPWVVAAVLAVVIAYTPPILQIVGNNYPAAKGFRPDKP